MAENFLPHTPPKNGLQFNCLRQHFYFIFLAYAGKTSHSIYLRGPVSLEKEGGARLGWAPWNHTATVKRGLGLEGEKIFPSSNSFPLPQISFPSPIQRKKRKRKRKLSFQSPYYVVLWTHWLSGRDFVFAVRPQATPKNRKRKKKVSSTRESNFGDCEKNTVVGPKEGTKEAAQKEIRKQKKAFSLPPASHNVPPVRA